MKVTVKYFASIRDITGKREEVLELDDGATLETVLQKLSKVYGAKFHDYVFDEKTHAVRNNLEFLIDGRSSSTLRGLGTTIRNGYQLAIIPPVGGG